MGMEPLSLSVRGGCSGSLLPLSPALSSSLFPLLPSPSSSPTLIHPFMSRLKEELEKLGVQVTAQAQSKQEDGASQEEAVSPES